MAVYLDSSTILDAAEERLQRTHHRIGGRNVIRSKGVCFWGKVVDERFLCRLTLWIVDGFNSVEERRLCLEHFSSQSSPTAITTCSELTDQDQDEYVALGIWSQWTYVVQVDHFE